MWAIPPQTLCGRHLIAEHNETHHFVEAIRRRQKIQGYIDHGLVEIHNLRKRHDELRDEMKARGYYHDDLNDDGKWRGVTLWEEGSVDRERSIATLKDRCDGCRVRIENYKESGDQKVTGRPRLRGHSTKSRSSRA